MNYDFMIATASSYKMQHMSDRMSDILVINEMYACRGWLKYNVNAVFVMY